MGLARAAGSAWRLGTRTWWTPVAITEWLKGPARDRPTGVRVRAMEAFGALSQWLALREPGYCFLSALGDAADRGVLPDLFGWSSISTVRQSHTIGVFGEVGLCLCMRPPDSPPAAWAGAGALAPFELFVRTLGLDDGLAARVVERIRAWDAAGRPSRQGMRIRAYPRDTEYVASEGELVVDKRWSRLVLDWPPGG